MLSLLPRTFALMVICSPVAAGTPQCDVLHFDGEVSGGESFYQPLGMDLAFRMEPVEEHWGWNFEIGPVNAGKGEFNSFIYALNPPWRGRNITNLSIEYGTPAQEVVIKGAREFWFLARREDGAQAELALNDILWPTSEKAQEVGISKLGTLTMGRGIVRVLDADFDPGTSAPASNASTSAYGAIYRIVFSVDLTVPPGFTPAKGLLTTRATCPDPKNWVP